MCVNANGLPDANLAQALHTFNGDTVAKKVSDKNGRVMKLIAAKTAADDLVEELYLAGTVSTADSRRTKIQSRSLAAGANSRRRIPRPVVGFNQFQEVSVRALSIKSMNRLAFFLAGTLLLVTPAVAQQSYPMLMSIEPVAAAVGQTSDHVVKSRYSMAGAYEVLVSGEGVTGQVVLPETKDSDKQPKALVALPVRFTVAATATPGVRDFRIATPAGVSTTGQLVIVRDPIVVESGDNNTVQGANEITLPATLCGRIEKAEDVDFFRFEADAGDTICFHARCMRLQDRIHDLQQHADPILSLRNASGSTIAAADNVFAADPLLTHTFDEAGVYYLELRDVRYQGNQYWCYSIEANRRPFIQTIFPLAHRVQDPQPVELIGHLFTESAQGTVAPPMPPRNRRHATVSRNDALGGQATYPGRLY